ncbi:calaxin-like [Littorina saxatilis]|uniref:EF-hand domain-containing protein n=1 Tax=Littorina saxatilis TaxID=31220 RepID=A0AAN9GHR6_9CAEN
MSVFKKKFVNPHKLEKKIVTLSKESKLKRETVKQLMYYFQTITKKYGGKMPRTQFRQEMTSRFNLMDDFMLDNLYRCFDLKNRGSLTMEEYLRGMGGFLSDDMEIITKLSFTVYDLNGDGYITREEMMQWLKTSLTRQSHEDDSDEGVKELIDIIIKKLDCLDHDNRVSLKDFRAAVAEDDLLLESLSSCLPPTENKKAFFLMISGDLKYTLSPSGPSAPVRFDAPVRK